MKAITCRSYGPPSALKLEEVQTPEPKKNEILIRIHASAVNTGDLRIRKADPFLVRLFFGFFKLRNPILGSVFGGRIERIGENVTKFNIGDKIFGMSGFGLGFYAQYKCLSESGTICKIPTNSTFQEAASIPFGGLTAVHFLKLCNVQSGQKVLVYGASGAVGTAAIQYAKVLGAEVTAVCSSSNFEFVKSLGADNTIDYLTEDFSTKGVLYDVIYETVGKTQLKSNLKALKKNGILILGSASFVDTLKGFWISMVTSFKVVSGVGSERTEDLQELCNLIEKGKYKPVIDKVYPLEKTAEAHEYADQGHKKGNVVIEIE